MRLVRRYAETICVNRYNPYMKIVVFTPSATGLVSVPEDFSADACFFANPEEQVLSGNGARNFKNYSENDFLISGEFDSINHLAKWTARSWFDEPEINDLLQVDGINVGSVFARSLSYRLVASLKALRVFELIAVRFAPESVFLVGAANCAWVNAAKFLFDELKIPFSVQCVPTVAAGFIRGYLDWQDSFLFERMEEMLDFYIANYALVLSKNASLGRELVDGLGGDRLAAEIVKRIHGRD